MDDNKKHTGCFTCVHARPMFCQTDCGKMEIFCNAIKEYLPEQEECTNHEKSPVYK